MGPSGHKPLDLLCRKRGEWTKQQLKLRLKDFREQRKEKQQQLFTFCEWLGKGCCGLYHRLKGKFSRPRALSHDELLAFVRAVFPLICSVNTHWASTLHLKLLHVLKIQWWTKQNPYFYEAYILLGEAQQCVYVFACVCVCTCIRR